MILRLLARGRTGRRTAIPARTVETPRRSSVNLFKGHTTSVPHFQDHASDIATIVGAYNAVGLSVPRASTRARRGRWCRNPRRCSKAWDSVTGSLSTTKAWRQTSW